MKLFLACALLFLSARADDAEVDDRDVVVLTQSNFDSTLADLDLALVEFYAPWCGHCKHLAPEYAKAATDLKADGVVLGKVDATIESSLASEYGVSGYPTLKIFRKGKAFEYAGPRQHKGIVDFMRKQNGPASKVVSSVSAATALIGRDPSQPTIFFFMSAKGSNYDVYADVANELREDFTFGESSDASVLAHYGITKNTIVAFKPSRFVAKAFDEERSELSGKFTAASLKEWIYDEAFPLVSQVTKENQKLLTHGGSAVLYAFGKIDYERDPKGTNYVANRVRKAAKAVNAAHPDALIRFAVASKDEFSGDLDKFGVRDAVNGGAVGVGIEKGSLRYKMESDFSPENVEAFVKDFLAGKVDAFIKSQPVPEPAAPGEVVTVVGKNFNEVVLDPTKDVFFEMYAPWCGHCKHLEPVYKDLALHFKNDPNVVIAKMDATANDSPHAAYTANGYPTLYFAKAGAKHAPQKYDGGRELDDLIKHVRDNASKPVVEEGGKKGKKKKKGHDEV